MSELRKLISAIENKKTQEMIESYESVIADSIMKYIKEDSLYSLPLSSLIRIVSQINLEIDDQYPSVIADIVQKTILKHPHEKEVLFFLYAINPAFFGTLDECFKILNSFTKCPFLKHISQLRCEESMLVIPDLEYEYQQEIKKLKAQIERYEENGKYMEFKPITEKPRDFDSNLFSSAKSCKLGSVQYLIEVQKANPNQVDPKFRFAPIHGACEGGNLNVVQYLVEKCKVDCEVQTYAKWRPLHIAASYGNLEIVKYLIKKAKVEINCKDLQQNTPLFLAVKGKHFDIIKYLIEETDASTNDTDSNGLNLLHIAAMNGYVEIFKYLLQKTTLSLESTDKKGNTPLHLASKNGKVALVEFLVDKGVNKNSRNSDNKTALDLVYTKSDIIRQQITRSLN